MNANLFTFVRIVSRGLFGFLTLLLILVLLCFCVIGCEGLLFSGTFFVRRCRFEMHRIFFLMHVSFGWIFILLSIHGHRRHYRGIIISRKIIQYVSIIL